MSDVEIVSPCQECSYWINETCTWLMKGKKCRWGESH